MTHTLVKARFFSNSIFKGGKKRNGFPLLFGIQSKLSISYILVPIYNNIKIIIHLNRLFIDNEKNCLWAMPGYSAIIYKTFITN